MAFYILDYKNVALFLLFSALLSAVLLTASFLATFSSKLDIEKSSIYECGFNPFSETRYQFNVLFYLVAILFLLFDIEVLYLFPFAISFHSLSALSLLSFTLFFALLFIGLVIEITKGILNLVTPEKSLAQS
jgi:NADH-quinone oxidoreductase subunit A